MRSIDLSDNRESDIAMRMRKQIVKLSCERAKCIVSGNVEQAKRYTADIEMHYMLYQVSKKRRPQ